MPIDISLARQAVDPGVFELIVLPTEQCNFRCTYCYEDFVVRAMPSSVVEATKALVSARADGSNDLVLSWFGGEPLLAKEVVLDVSRHAHECYRRVGRAVQGHMTTNGYLLDPPTFESLVNHDIRYYQITLDGDEQWHDQRRITQGGRGTFQSIWRRLIDLRDLTAQWQGVDFQIMVRVHYDGASVGSLPAFVTRLADAFSGAPGFVVNLHELETLGGPHDGDLVQLTRDQRDLVNAQAERLAERGLLTLVAAAIEDYVCYASKANSLIIRADGRIAKCTVALADERNEVGRIGGDGTISWERDRLDLWLRGLRSGDPAELACPRVGLPSQVDRGGRGLLPLTVAAGAHG